LSVVIFGN